MLVSAGFIGYCDHEIRGGRKCSQKRNNRNHDEETAYSFFEQCGWLVLRVNGKRPRLYCPTHRKHHESLSE